jgi:23S rRNA pseudouridine1911/1915/1917 synthase
LRIDAFLTKAGVLLNVVYQDGDLLVLNKPADLVCHPTKGDEYSSLIGRVRLHVGVEVRPQLINRLDRETSGLTLVALNLPAARELRRAWELRQVEKTYLAIVHGHMAADSGTIEACLGPDEQSRVAIKDCVRPDGAQARTDYRIIRRFERLTGPGDRALAFSLVEVRPLTGRKHQIRIHLAHLGHPIVGDKIYGEDEEDYLALVERRLTPERRERLILPCQALHASGLRFSWREREWSFDAEPEDWFSEFAS